MCRGVTPAPGSLCLGGVTSHPPTGASVRTGGTWGEGHGARGEEGVARPSGEPAEREHPQNPGGS